MIHHMFKLVWQRKSRHLLLSLEILLAFLVVFALCASAGRYYQLFQLPTGLNHQARWLVSIEGQVQEELTPTATAATTVINTESLMSQYQRALKQIPALQQVSFTDMPLYDLSRQNTLLQRADTGQSLEVDQISVSDDFFAAAELPLIAGRSFNQTDNGAAHQPVVIDQRLADTLFPGIDPIGQLLRDDATSSSSSYQIIGLVKALRTQGELMAVAPTIISRLPEQSVPWILLLQLAAGTDRAIEQQLLQQLKQVRSDWSYNIEPLTQKRQSMLRTQMIPLLILAVLSAFLLSMVAFGLFGVLWQHTSQRIPELGLRRAIGATAGNIYWQIIAEQLMLNLLAVSIALLLLVQLPLTGVLGEHLDWPLFGVASLGAILIICVLSVLCALYPAWRASRLTPTEALHYE
ncbi:FtsX-like permease family protein [Rheinheimera riviphila]|uniref:FtsX-like permease family protein n=1 Tax=Rheinheimera riviphila TaxID=1834037 RepID=A0A437R4D3_9GAMM|nr:FtsX-like permease family protein [Rheinheimera riviphila]RVU41636.1 FtsX-like permease family protein [Rheinheimera riviphila]